MGELKILDLSAGNRAVWFCKDDPRVTYVDLRESVKPNVCVDTRSLPFAAGVFSLVLFDPPHENFSANGNMSKCYGHWTHAHIKSTIEGTAIEVRRVTRLDALMALKWNEHSIKLATVLKLLAQCWAPLFGHGVSHQQKGTSWVMLRRKDLPWE
jgi:hypothetical protein